MTYQGQHLPSPLIEKDLEKVTRDLKNLRCQVPFYVAFQVNNNNFQIWRKWDLKSQEPSAYTDVYYIQ